MVLPMIHLRQHKRGAAYEAENNNGNVAWQIGVASAPFDCLRVSCIRGKLRADY